MNKTGEIEIGEQIISFERAETNQVKWLRQKNSPGVNLHCTVICINLANDFRECATLDAVYEEIFKLDIFIESE